MAYYIESDHQVDPLDVTNTAGRVGSIKCSKLRLRAAFDCAVAPTYATGSDDTRIFISNSLWETHYALANTMCD